jgi:hypothetical protein
MSALNVVLTGTAEGTRRRRYIVRYVEGKGGVIL